MFKSLTLLFVVLAFCVQNNPHAALAGDPLPLIFDTDMTGDVDDALALAMLHAFANRKECEIKAITISKINPLAAPFIDAVNTYYGRPDIPIGATHNAQKRSSKYLSIVQAKKGEQLRYPHDLKSGDHVPDAVEILRKTLCEANDNSIVIIQVGLASNLAALLKSPADKYSPLTGIELVRKKVKFASVMAGAFSPVNGNDHFLEANVRNGISSMREFATNWPQDIPVIWSDFLIGISAPYPRESIARDFNYEPHHIIKEAYLLHSGPNHNRPTWDLTSVLYAVRTADNYFSLSKPGLVTVEKDGFTTFTPQSNGRDRYLMMDRKQAIRVIATQRTLVSAPPIH